MLGAALTDSAGPYNRGQLAFLHPSFLLNALPNVLLASSGFGAAERAGPDALMSTPPKACRPPQVVSST